MRESATPNLGLTRRNGTKKYGFGFNFEQAISNDVGVFARYGWSDGKTETWAFTEIDRSVSAGASVRGRWWRRRGDVVGVGAVENFLSGDHRSFPAAGGVGRPEQIVESYYSFRASKQWTVTADCQHIVNPAYNRDRGPVRIATLRLHWER